MENDKLPEVSKQYRKKGYQCSLFTKEQQTGSGQLNLIDQIENYKP